MTLVIGRRALCLQLEALRRPGLERAIDREMIVRQERRDLVVLAAITLRDIPVVGSRLRFLVDTVGLRPGASPVQG